jgi:hypothetical protein
VSGLRKMQPLMGQLYSFSSYIYIYIYIYLDPPFIIYIKNEYLSQGARGHFFCPIKEVPFDKKKKKKPSNLTTMEALSPRGQGQFLTLTTFLLFLNPGPDLEKRH